jgi:hypothetical protein
MRRRREFCPEEPRALEDRIALSVMSPAHATVHTLRAPRTVAVTITGVASVSQPATPGAPESIVLFGSGKYLGLDKMTLSGPLSVNLSVTPGSSGISGTLHISSRLGSADLRFIGQQEALIPSKPQVVPLSYAVIHGTGLFAGTGTQSTTLYLKPPRNGFEPFRIGIHN